jgi:PAS domain S-box-containing protein
MNNLSFGYSSRLGRRLLVWIALISTGIAFVATSVQLYLYYQRDLQDMDAKLAFVQENLAPGITEAAWNFDRRQLQAQIQGIVNAPWVSGVLIDFGTDGNENEQAGNIDMSSPHTKSIRLERSVGSEIVMVGRLFLQPNMNEVYQRSRDRIAVVVSTEFVKILIISFFLIGFVHFMITRHLGSLSEYARKFSPDVDYHPLILDRSARTNDELDDLLASLNTAYLRLHENFQLQKGQQDRLMAEVALRTGDLDKANQRLAMSLKAGRLGTWDWDAKSNENKVDKAWLDMLGYRQDEFPHTLEGLVKLMHPDDVPRMTAAVVAHLAGETDFYDIEFRLLANDGKWRWIHSGGLGIERDDAGHINRMVGIHQDVTERHDAEQARQTFISSVSHEIRTPMNAIIGFASLALNTDLSPKQQDYLNKIVTAAHSLLRIVNDVLDYSKIEAGKLAIQHEPFLLSDVLASVLDMATVTADSKGVVVRLAVADATPDLMIGDSLRIEQILINLASNAVKFTASGVIEIAVSAVCQADNRCEVHFSVKDSGIGIAPGKLATLFHPFVQADSSITRRYGGTGLGLAICQKLVTLLHGKIWAESTPGQGSTFHFTLSFELPSTALVPATYVKTSAVDRSLSTEYRLSRIPHRPPMPPAALAGKHILLVEDNTFNRQVASEFLEAAGMVVETAANGREAVAYALDIAYDAVLMDIQMPEMDGLSATRELRSHPHLITLPIIAMTAHGMSEDRERSLAAGMNDHLTKPINPTVLYEILLKWILPEARYEAVATEAGQLDNADLPAMPGVDHDIAMLLCQGDLNKFAGLLRLFLAEIGEVADSLRPLFAARDLPALAMQAHTIKGAAGNLGAQTLSSHAGQLEKSLLAGEAERSENMIGAIEVDLWQLGDTHAMLEQVTPGNDRHTTVAATLTSDELHAALDELEKKIVSHSFIDTAQIGQISPHCVDPACQLHWLALSSALENFAYAKASAAIQELRRAMQR